MILEATDAAMLRCATEFVVQRENGDLVTITRRTNHGRALPDGEWAAMIVAGPMNPWYLGDDGRWRYKSYATFGTARDAWEAARVSETLADSYAAASSREHHS